MEYLKSKAPILIKAAFFLIAVIIIEIAINIPVLMILPKNFTVEEKIEASCYEVINFAIAVWASLNIVNFFDRKDFEKFKETSKRDMQVFKEEQNRVSDEVNAKNKLLDAIFYEQFLQELLKTNKDIVSERFYIAFSDMNEEEADIPFEQLLIVERLYEQAFQLYFNGNEGIDFNCIKRVAQKGIESIRKCKTALDSRHADIKIANCFLLFREAEFLYYSNFKDKDDRSSIDQMRTAKTLYIQAVEMLGVNISDYSVRIDNIIIPNDLDRKLCAYSLNTVGSVCNWLYKYMPQDYAPRAESYCTNAVVCAGYEFEREVYYRNCGVAKEHVGKYDEAFEYYLKAFATTDINTKTMHCLLSVIDKQINKIIHIADFISHEVERKPLFGSNEHLLELKDVDLIKVEEKQMLLKQYCEFTLSVFPNYIDGYLYMAIYNRNIVLVNMLKNDYIDNRYLLKARRDIEIARSLNHDNNYVSIISKDISALKSLRS